MKRRRVKITGLGFVTPAGVGKEEFCRGILENRSRIGPITRFPEIAGDFVAAEVKGFNIAEHFEETAFRRVPRHTQFALVATKFALRDANLSRSAAQNLGALIVTGTSLMDSDIINRTIENTALKGPRHALSRVVFQAPVASIAASVSELVGGSRTLALQSACCSGMDAIGHAAAMIGNGEADVAICGGTEAPIYYHPMLELGMAGLSPVSADRPEQSCRPFDMWRTTGVIGEGACMMVLEPESSPRPGYAFVSGYSFASDPSASLGEGLRNAIEQCIANARARPSDIETINAWGPGHREIDAAEADVLHEVFGAKLEGIPTVSIKGAIGNPFAAAGAIQAGTAALGMRLSFIPPTVNWQHADPACRLNLSGRARFISFDTAVINSHGLSGTNSALLLERCPSDQSVTHRPK
jgi:3-oxoacyl-(acyl-carrier-protein) synthase